MINPTSLAPLARTCLGAYAYPSRSFFYLTQRAICVPMRDLYLYPVKSLTGSRSLFLAFSLPLPL